MGEDFTTHDGWLEEQTDRFLAFEVLHKAVTAAPETLSASELGDKIGVWKGYTHQVLKDIKRRHNTNG